MSDSLSWLDTIKQQNRSFTQRIMSTNLPVKRAPGPAIVTCMDPRVNLAALGVSGFAEDGSTDSTVRVIRTIGAVADDRSLIIGIFLANISEIVVLMHTDCGCCLAHEKIDAVISRMQERLSPHQFNTIKQTVGEPFREKLRTYLHTFENPFEAVKKEVEAIKLLPFAPRGLVVHGLVYTLETGDVEVVVDGYQ